MTASKSQKMAKLKLPFKLTPPLRKTIAFVRKHPTKIIILASLIIELMVIFLILYNSSIEKQKNSIALETLQNEQQQLPKDAQQQLATAPANLKIPILLYHYVEFVKDKRDTIRQSLDVIPPIFDKQMATLTQAHYTFLTAHDLAEILSGKMKLPDKPILITFDDGHRDLATDVLPILQKYQVKATAYIIPGFLGKSDFLTDQQLQLVAQSELVEIGAHTIHHIALKGKPLSQVTYEVVGSKSMLEGLIGQPVVSFAYPYGSFDRQAETVVQQAGFKSAVTTVAGFSVSSANQYFLFRIRPGSRTGPSLLTLLNKTTSSINTNR